MNPNALINNLAWGQGGLVGFMFLKSVFCSISNKSSNHWENEADINIAVKSADISSVFHKAHVEKQKYIYYVNFYIMMQNFYILTAIKA